MVDGMYTRRSIYILSVPPEVEDRPEEKQTHPPYICVEFPQTAKLSTHNHNGEQARDLADRTAFMWRGLGGVVIIDLAVLVIEETAVPDFCTRGD